MPVWGSRAAIELEDLEPTVRVAEETGTNAVQRVTRLDGVPPGAIGRSLDAPSWIRDAQGPADENQSAPIEHAPVRLLPALIGLEDDLGAFCGSP